MNIVAFSFEFGVGDDSFDLFDFKCRRTFLNMPVVSFLYNLSNFVQ